MKHKNIFNVMNLSVKNKRNKEVKIKKKKKKITGHVNIQQQLALLQLLQLVLLSGIFFLATPYSTLFRYFAHLNKPTLE